MKKKKRLQQSTPWACVTFLAFLRLLPPTQLQLSSIKVPESRGFEMRRCFQRSFGTITDEAYPQYLDNGESYSFEMGIEMMFACFSI